VVLAVHLLLLVLHGQHAALHVSCGCAWQVDVCAVWGA
jgi:hypothetical protein